MQRLAGTGGDPVIGLQTAFGGGKTHTMLADLSSGEAPARRRRSAQPGRRRAARGRGWATSSWPKPKIAVFVGSSKGTDVSLTLEGRPAGPHALGLHRLAPGRRSWAEADRGGRGGADQPRLGIAGRSVPARRAERDPARRTGHVRAPTAGRPVRGVPVLHSVADRGGEDGAGHPGRWLAARERCRGRRGKRRAGAAAVGGGVRPRAFPLGCRRRATKPTRSSAAACSSRSTPRASGHATRR